MSTLVWYFVRALTARWRAIRDKSIVDPKAMGSSGRIQGVGAVCWVVGGRRVGLALEGSCWISV